LLDAITFWFPAYRLNALVRFITGVVSWITVFQIFKLMPVAMSLKTHDQLEREITDRKRAEEELRIANQQLNEAQEIAKMGHWQPDLESNTIVWSDGLYKINRMPPKSAIEYDEMLALIHPEDRQLLQSAIAEALKTKTYTPFLYRTGQNGGYPHYAGARQRDNQ
jgi:PAS domain-containing protein